MDSSVLVHEAERKRELALNSAGPFATSDPADVRWLLCGRGRPVSAGSSPYTVEVSDEEAVVWYQDIERSRVEAEERWEELGYEARAHPWYEQAPVRFSAPDLLSLRLDLCDEEVARYRAAAADVAGAFTDVLPRLEPALRELDATAFLAELLHAQQFTTPVLLAGGEERAPVHRHPLPTDARLGRFALLAATAERDGLYVSMTRIVSFGRAPEALARRVQEAAEVDGYVLAASGPGKALGELFGVLADAYEQQGRPEEWRLHHQGGLTGYRGREVFAHPGGDTRLPPTCALAWNPSVTGGGKSEDTVIATADGIEVLTRTRSLPELDTSVGIPRAAIVEL